MVNMWNGVYFYRIDPVGVGTQVFPRIKIERPFAELIKFPYFLLRWQGLVFQAAGYVVAIQRAVRLQDKIKPAEIPQLPRVFQKDHQEDCGWKQENEWRKQSLEHQTEMMPAGLPSGSVEMRDERYRGISSRTMV